MVPSQQDLARDHGTFRVTIKAGLHYDLVPFIPFLPADTKEANIIAFLKNGKTRMPCRLCLGAYARMNRPDMKLKYRSGTGHKIALLEQDEAKLQELSLKGDVEVRMDRLPVARQRVPL